MLCCHVLSCAVLSCSDQPRVEETPAQGAAAGITESETIGERVRRQAHVAERQQQQQQHRRQTSGAVATVATATVDDAKVNGDGGDGDNAGDFGDGGADSEVNGGGDGGLDTSSEWDEGDAQPAGEDESEEEEEGERAASVSGGRGFSELPCFQHKLSFVDEQMFGGFGVAVCAKLKSDGLWRSSVIDGTRVALAPIHSQSAK